MKKLLSFLLILFLILGMVSASAEGDSGILGKPFPDFTVTDTDGTPFTMSEALKDHEAVLINLWATWCQPCQGEFPFLEKVWTKYRDRVAFIALSADPNDTMEKVTAFRDKFGITFPVGLDTDRKLMNYTGSQSFPTTVIVDRFGNMGFLHTSAFMGAGEVERVLSAFLGETYTQTTVLEAIPADTSTGAFPVSPKRAVILENENVQTIRISIDGMDKQITCYVVPDETAHIRLEIGQKDNLSNMVYQDFWKSFTTVTELYDSARNAYVYDQAIEGESDGIPHHYSYGLLVDMQLYTGDTDAIQFFLIRDEQYMDEVTAMLGASGATVSGWEYTETEQTEGTAPQAYVVHVVDQDNNPVEEVTVNFCTDTACVPRESDENGTITFDGAPDVYHVQIIDVPDGYSYDESFELYTTREYGEWVLRVRKDG